MARIRQVRDPELSLWQSAVDEVVAKRKVGSQAQDIAGGAAAVSRPDSSDPMVHEAASFAQTAQAAAAVPSPAGGAAAATEAVGGPLGYCSATAYKLARAIFTRNKADEERYRKELGPFTTCDPGYAEAAVKYAEFLASRGTIPYRRHQALSDFVIEGKLPAKAKVALLGDWGTGQPEAKALLAQIARKNPDVVIHMWDIYYSGTAFEVDKYFLQIWKSTLDLSKTATYTLSGNHDMFCGGKPYYDLIDQLGQPASYFCLRNDNWQFLAMDTGLHDDVPLAGKPTFLEDSEVEWLTDKIENAGGRRSVLLSHHQLFSAYENIGGKVVNDRLNAQLAPLLPKVAMWFWGHEHDLVIYKQYMNVLGRCVGHGAFPIGISELPSNPLFPDVPLESVRLQTNAAFYNHGYVIVELDGASARVSYYQDTDEDNPLYQETVQPTASTSRASGN